ncbi:ATP-binding protein [Streptomyces litchfieldiae]|uniref:ATP-binding protein n=1 Tax=Streptomyces litchfieldiae TaxID=3075543 RepID=A0ABU2MRS4_9ACTN|nr:ATP-binding protein [Streptomyces sp. DSM 44938]MDT0344329.1 ATP-binding protein [Streptomyces sp. DSM 44938]
MNSRSGALPPPVASLAPGRTGAWRFTVAPLDVSVPRIRHVVRDLVRRQRAPLSGDRLQGALLILSELVTNAVRHAALLTSEIGVEVVLDAHGLRLSVEDGHPYRPRALEANPERQHTSGRGLLLVKAIALETGGDCGVEPTAAGGKVVWAALPFDAG